MLLGASCSNDRDGYSVDYPDGWYTVTDLPAWRCALFDPDPIVIQEFSELPITAVFIYVDDNPYDEVVAALTDPNYFKVGDLAGDTFTDADLPGVAMRVRQTEDLFYSRGTRFFYVVIDRVDKTIVVQTISYATGSFAENAEIALEMAHRIRITG